MTQAFTNGQLNCFTTARMLFLQQRACVDSWPQATGPALSNATGRPAAVCEALAHLPTWQPCMQPYPGDAAVNQQA